MYKEMRKGKLRGEKRASMPEEHPQAQVTAQVGRKMKKSGLNGGTKPKQKICKERRKKKKGRTKFHPAPGIPHLHGKEKTGGKKGTRKTSGES